MASKLDILRLFSQFDDDVDIADFSTEELEEMLNGETPASEDFKKKYFEYYDDVKDKSLKKQDW